MAHLPFRGEDGAPFFDGSPRSLLRYFRDIDLLYASLRITPSDFQKIAQTIYYLDNDTASLWETIEPPSGSSFTWEEWKNQVKTFYPGCEGDRLYSLRDLETHIRTHAINGVLSSDHLGEYFRGFSLISTYLLKRGQIGNLAIDKLYIQGFGSATRHRYRTTSRYSDSGPPP
jgi:hypothetical protein